MRIGTWVLATAAGWYLAASAASAEEHHCQIGKLLELPVTMVNRQPTVVAELDGHKLHLTVDSGAFFSSLTPGTAAQYDFRRHMAPPGLRVIGLGGEIEAQVTTVDEFKLGRLELHRVDFLVGGSEIGPAGLLGQNILGAADVEYDLADGVVRLMRPQNCDKDTNLAYWAKGKSVSMERIESFDTAEMHTQGTVILNGVKLKAMFDTGAATTILSERAAARLGVEPGGPGVTEAGYSGGLGRRKVKTWVGPFASLQIGDNETIKNIRLRFGDLGEIDDIDMMIGADFFLSHRVYVSNKLRRMFLTYNGGPVFDLTTQADDERPAARALTNAGEYSRRGMAFAARHDYAAALDDLSHAIALASNDGHYRYQRATVELAMKDAKAAEADLDAAVEGLPRDAPSRLMRAWLRLAREDTAGARADADAADAALAAQSDSRFELGQIYAALDLPAKEIAQYDMWIDAHPRDNKLASAYNSRCWVRATRGSDLEAAMSDCNRAVHLRPDDSDIRDSRGLAHLRRGDLEDAIDDYDDALKGNPKMPTSLYGRGVAELKLGRKAAGDADIAAAKKIDADIGKTMKANGVAP